MKPLGSFSNCQVTSQVTQRQISSRAAPKPSLFSPVFSTSASKSKAAGTESPPPPCR